MERYQPNILSIYDELFAYKKDRAVEFCERIKAYDIPWAVQLHVSVVDAELIERMADSGCKEVSYGLESANEHVLSSMKKKATRTQIANALEITYERKLGIQGNFIFGDAAETLATASDTLHWWAAHRHYGIALSFLKVYPGTAGPSSIIRIDWSRAPSTSPPWTMTPTST